MNATSWLWYIWILGNHCSIGAPNFLYYVCTQVRARTFPTTIPSPMLVNNMDVKVLKCYCHNGEGEDIVGDP
jgi:hypothetical protein